MVDSNRRQPQLTEACADRLEQIIQDRIVIYIEFIYTLGLHTISLAIFSKSSSAMGWRARERHVFGSFVAHIVGIWPPK